MISAVRWSSVAGPMTAFRYICMCSSDKEIYSVCMDGRTVTERGNGIHRLSVSPCFIIQKLKYSVYVLGDYLPLKVAALFSTLWAVLVYDLDGRNERIPGVPGIVSLLRPHLILDSKGIPCNRLWDFLSQVRNWYYTSFAITSPSHTSEKSGA